MAIVRTYDGLVASQRENPLFYTGSGNVDVSGAGWLGDYATLYATQPNVRTCVDFLARNIAQLGYDVFRRVGDTERVRLRDHPLAQWIGNPNPYTTTYRLFESCVADLGVYFMAFWLKVRLGNGRIGLVRLPPQEMDIEGGLLPKRFIWLTGGQRVPLATTEVVYFNGYNPLHSLKGLSPLETLRATLANDIAATAHRERYWLNASRVEGVIERPRDAPRWTPQQKDQWRTQWQQRYVGVQSAGSVPVLEDGMTFKQISWSAKDSEYVSARKLSLEEVIRQYQIPPPMVGYLEHATFSNIKEQHKQMYSDCLGPWLKMLVEAIALQLLPEARDSTDIYGEFNVNEKLRGNFEEQTNSLRVAIGRPFMTANEGRARLNLPRIDDDPSADQLAAQQGGPSNVAAGPDPALQEPSDKQAAMTGLVRAHLGRQSSHLQRVPVPDRAEAFNATRWRWQTELASDLEPHVGRTQARGYAALVTEHTYALLQDGVDAFTTDREVPYVW